MTQQTQDGVNDRPVIVARRLGKRVPLASGTLTILDGVDLSVRAGESVALVGASGSGKSTLLALLAGLDLPSEGEVELDGRALQDLDEDARAALRAGRVGFVFQSFQLLAPLTALENVMLPLDLAGRRDAATRAEKMLKQVGLEERLHHYPKQLSGGEQQRVAMARAFVVEPSILFADEPTGNLDTVTGKAVADLLFDMNQRTGTTLLLVTHDERLASRCDRQIRLDAGRVVA